MKFNDFRLFIYEEFGDRRFSPSEAIQKTGASKGSAYRWLKMMVEFGELTNDGGSYGFPLEIPAAEVHKPVEVEVIEERMPRAAMAAIKKVAPITAITPQNKELAPYLQEQKAENTWAHILSNANISDGMKSPSDVSKLSGNWRFFVVDIDLCGLGLMSVGTITERFKGYLESKAKKDAPLIDPRDISVFVADKIWEAKLSNDAILNPALKLQAQFWQCDRTYRNRLHEALIKSGKWFLTEVNQLLALGNGGSLSKDELDRYLKEYGDRQKVFLDEMLNSRQSQAKKVVAEEIGKALNVHQLPEAK